VIVVPNISENCALTPAVRVLCGLEKRFKPFNLNGYRAMFKVMGNSKYRLITSILFLACCLSNTARARDFVDLVQYCEECHGLDGVSTIPEVPIIAGFSEEGFLNTIDVFRENERIAMEFHIPGEPETVMNEIAQSLNDDEVEELAKYFSGLEFKPAKQSADPEKASRGAILHKKSCEKCHTNNGKDPVEDAAILAGQWTPYLQRQFDNILTKKRLVPKSMYRRVKKLSAQDIEALLHFYAQEGNK